MLLNNSVTSLQSIGQLICLVFLFIFVLVLAYLAARITGGFQSNVINKNSNIKVVEVFRLSNNKVIEIVKIGEHYFAIAVCKDCVTLLGELDELEVKDSNLSIEPINFKNVLDKIKNEKRDK